MALLNDKIEQANIHKFSHTAMATVYEIMIEYDDKLYAEQVAKAAFDELDRLENELSRFLPNSEISRINNLNVGQELLLTEDTFECLTQSQRLFELTKGAFDIAIGSYKENWGKQNSFSENLIEEGTYSDIPKFVLNELERTITVLGNNLSIDLGGFGKGYALDKVCDQLLDWEISNAFIHGGGSSVKSIGSLTNISGWPITLSNPNNSNQSIADMIIKDFSLSASGIKKGEHIFDPIHRTPISARKAAWATASSAMVSDALSTAFMIMDKNSILELCRTDIDIGAMIIEDGKQELTLNDLTISEHFKIEKLLI